MLKNKMRPIHPGEILREEYLDPLNITPNALAKSLHLHAARINEIVRENRGVTPDTALRLARFFGTTPEFWLNLQMAYDLRSAQKVALKAIEKEIQPLEFKAARVKIL